MSINEPETINEWAQTIHQWARDKGWQIEESNFGELMMLVGTEVAEAFEEYRDGHYFNETYYTTDKRGNQKPEGVPSELADIVIRVLHICAAYDIDLQAMMTEKMAYNESRPYRHGGKRA